MDSNQGSGYYNQPPNYNQGDSGAYRPPMGGGYGGAAPPPGFYPGSPPNPGPYGNHTVAQLNYIQKLT